MDIRTLELLARRHDDSIEACALRLRAARMVTGETQKDAARLAGIGHTSWNNAEAARNFPQLDAMRWLFRAHRIDFNFLIAGEISQLPGDVQAALFDALSAISSPQQSDQTASSGRLQVSETPSRT